MNIYEKLSSISAELSAVAKNLSVGYGKSSYKAVGEADVLAAIKPLEAKYKVYSYPFSRKIAESGQIESVNSNGEVKKSIFLRIEVIYRFVNTEKPDEFIDITTYGDGIDSADKAVGKAMTYADKYALLKAYKIITGDDPDQFASEPLKKVETKKSADNVSPETLAKAKELGIEPQAVASYFKKSVWELTEDELKWAISKKEAKC